MRNKWKGAISTTAAAKVENKRRRVQSSAALPIETYTYIHKRRLQSEKEYAAREEIR